MTADGGDLTPSALVSILTVDDLDVGGSTFNVSGAAQEYNDAVAGGGIASLAQATSLTVNDAATEKVVLDVSGFDTLKALLDPTHVNVVDAVSSVTGYAGDLTVVNRVTLEAESDGQDLSGLNIDGFDGIQSANLSLAGFNNIASANFDGGNSTGFF